MPKRLLLIAVALMTAAAPIAHEICQLSCASPSMAHTARAAQPPGHEHCSQAAAADRGGAVKMSAAPVADCRSQSDEPAWTATFAKIGAPAPAILAPAALLVPIATRLRVRTHWSAPPSGFVPAPTQLRV
jgi:hypothetical protein